MCILETGRHRFRNTQCRVIQVIRHTEKYRVIQVIRHAKRRGRPALEARLVNGGVYYRNRTCRVGAKRHRSTTLTTTEHVRQRRHSYARFCSLHLHSSRYHYPQSHRALTVRGALITAATAGPIVVSIRSSNAGLRCRESAGLASPTHSQEPLNRKGVIGVPIRKTEPVSSDLWSLRAPFG
jgi:hypothetical protein